MEHATSPVLVMVGVVVVGGGAIVGALWALARRATRALDAQWAAYAASRGLAFAPARGGAARQITATVGTVSVAIDTLFERVGRGPARVVRVRASSPAPSLWEFAVWPAGQTVVPREPPPGPSLFAGQPTTGPVVTLGDPEFDRAFTVVSAADAGQLAHVLNSAVRSRLLELGRVAPISLVRRRDEAVVTWFGAELDPARTDAACEIAALVAGA